jgi:hypothetical protein
MRHFHQNAHCVASNGKSRFSAIQSATCQECSPTCGLLIHSVRCCQLSRLHDLGQIEVDRFGRRCPSQRRHCRSVHLLEKSTDALEFPIIAADGMRGPIENGALLAVCPGAALLPSASSAPTCGRSHEGLLDCTGRFDGGIRDATADFALLRPESPRLFRPIDF